MGGEIIDFESHEKEWKGKSERAGKRGGGETSRNGPQKGGARIRMLRGESAGEEEKGGVTALIEEKKGERSRQKHPASSEVFPFRSPTGKGKTKEAGKR